VLKHIIAIVVASVCKRIRPCVPAPFVFRAFAGHNDHKLSPPSSMIVWPVM
jgi:hypothetical protein